MSSCPARSSASRAATISAAHDVGVGCVGVGVDGVVVASGVAVAEVSGLLGAALEVTTLDEADELDGLDGLVTAPAAPVVPALVALPVEHAATSEVRTRATGRAARGIRLGIVRA